MWKRLKVRGNCNVSPLLGPFRLTMASKKAIDKGIRITFETEGAGGLRVGRVGFPVGVRERDDP